MPPAEHAGPMHAGSPRLLQLLRQASPGDAAEALLAAGALPAEGALADLDRAQELVVLAHPELDGGAGLGDVPRLQRDVDRIALLSGRLARPGHGGLRGWGGRESANQRRGA